MNKWIQNLAQSVQLRLQISAFVPNLLYVYVYPLNSFSTYTCVYVYLNQLTKKQLEKHKKLIDCNYFLYHMFHNNVHKYSNMDF